MRGDSKADDWLSAARVFRRADGPAAAAATFFAELYADIQENCEFSAHRRRFNRWAFPDSYLRRQDFLDRRRERPTHDKPLRTI
jgi:hypothetical protein